MALRHTRKEALLLLKLLLLGNDVTNVRRPDRMFSLQYADLLLGMSHQDGGTWLVEVVPDSRGGQY